MTRHLSSTELVTALGHDATISPPSAAHLAHCALCQVRLARLQRGDGYAEPSNANTPRHDQGEPLISSELLAAVANLPTEKSGPFPGELWRAGRDEAVLVWVRDIIGDATVEVVPVVLHLAMADASSITIPAESTVLGVEAAAIVSMRCHLHPDSFINRLDEIDLEAKVADVVTATRSNRLPPIRTRGALVPGGGYHDADRSELEDLLATLSPSAWDSHDRLTDWRAATPPGTPEPGHHDQREASDTRSPGPGADRKVDFDTFAADLDHRLWGVRCLQVAGTSNNTDAMRVESFLKASFLDTTVLVVIATRHRSADFGFVVEEVVEAVEPFTRLEQDVDAIVVSMPHGDWQSVLITRAHMRSAVQLPAGDVAGPTFTISGFGLVDTLAKHFDGSVVAWEVLDESTSHAHGANLHDTALRHAANFALRVRTEGLRARTPGKVLGWRLEENVDADVARFVSAVAADVAVDVALDELNLEDR